MIAGGRDARPSIGVVIPAYNREATLGRAIESVLAQSEPASQIVVVDDGSTDATPAVAAAFGDRIDVRTYDNAGAATARNRGAEALTTTWMAFLDSDDHWSPDHLERIADAIVATDGRADVYFADTRRTADEGSALLWDLAGFHPAAPFELTDDAVDWVMLPRQPLMLQSSVVRRARYLEVGGLWPALRSRHDTHLFFVLGIGHPFCAVANVGVTMTADDRSGTRQMDAMGWQSAAFARHTVLLYDDVRRRFPDLAGEHDRQLRRRLAEGHLKLARHALAERRVTEGGASLGRAVRADPRRCAAAAGRAAGALGRRARDRVVRR
jgi:hypothetical protein